MINYRLITLTNPSVVWKSNTTFNWYPIGIICTKTSRIVGIFQNQIFANSICDLLNKEGVLEELVERAGVPNV